MLRSLPQRFNMKASAIKEANDIAIWTFGLTLVDNDSRGSKGVALHSVDDKDIQQNKDRLNDDNLTYSIALLNKQVSKIVRQFNKRQVALVDNITEIMATLAPPVLGLILQTNEGIMTKLSNL